MYAKIVFRNIKRNIKDYLIYIVTLVLCVSLFYAFMSIASVHYSQLIPLEYSLEQLQKPMKYCIAILTFLLIFLIKYVNSYIIRRKQKEFAIQTMLGMEQKITANMFFMETMIMGLIAIILGIFTGTFISQILTSIIMDYLGEEYKIYFSLFPDTILITIILFIAIFLIIGVSNVSTIRKIKIIDMLKANKIVQNNMKKEFLTPFILIIVCLIDIFMLRRNYYLYETLHNLTLSGVEADSLFLIYYINILCGVIFILLTVFYIFKCIVKRNFNGFIRFLTILNITAILIIFSAILFVNSSVFSETIKNTYFTFSVSFMIFFIFSFFYTLSDLMKIFREKSLKLKYKGNNLFLLGQINARLTSTSRTMSIVSATLLLSISAFTFEPIISGWALGYLEERAVFDYQISSGYKNPKISYQNYYDFVLEIAENENYPIKEYINMPIYTFKIGEKEANAVSLSDYNYIRKLSSAEEISLSEGEFTTQWYHKILPEDIEKILAENKTISVCGEKFKLSSESWYKAKLGEILYGFGNTDYSNFIFILPDNICKSLNVKDVNFYANVENGLKINYENAAKIYADIENYLKSSDYVNGMVRLKAMQRNEGLMATLITTLLFIYGGVMLSIICFTILSLQQLSDAYDFKQRFGIIKKLGVSETSVNKIILSQMLIWFGIPIILAVIGAVTVTNFYTQCFAQVVEIYIGFEALKIRYIKTAAVISAIFVCYFISTWIMFKRNIE